jgi:hypothetical protein
MGVLVGMFWSWSREMKMGFSWFLSLLVVKHAPFYVHVPISDRDFLRVLVVIYVGLGPPESTHQSRPREIIHQYGGNNILANGESMVITR